MPEPKPTEHGHRTAPGTGAGGPLSAAVARVDVIRSLAAHLLDLDAYMISAVGPQSVLDTFADLRRLPALVYLDDPPWPTAIAIHCPMPLTVLAPHVAHLTEHTATVTVLRKRETSAAQITAALHDTLPPPGLAGPFDIVLRGPAVAGQKPPPAPLLQLAEIFGRRHLRTLGAER
jgi:hypothetical protein